jgi:excisionase family DNA binding protein
VSTPRKIDGALLDLRTAAAYLGGNERWLRRLLERGVVPCRRIGRNVFFKKAELEEFVNDLPGISPRQARFNAKKKQAASG